MITTQRSELFDGESSEQTTVPHLRCRTRARHESVSLLMNDAAGANAFLFSREEPFINNQGTSREAESSRARQAGHAWQLSGGR